MARARNIKPGFFSNDALAELPALTRLMFAGLWTIADRAGRLEDRPKKIKAEVLPYDNANVDKMLDDLQAAGFVVRYQHGGNRYIQITKFEKHQNPHKNEAESTIPAPEQHSTSTVQEPAKDGTTRADSLLLIPDSLSTDSSTPARQGSPAPFEEFFEKYPKRAGSNPKERALKAYRARIAEGHSPDEILSGLSRYTAFIKATGKVGTEFVLQASTFLGPDKRFLEAWDAPTASGHAVPDYSVLWKGEDATH